MSSVPFWLVISTTASPSTTTMKCSIGSPCSTRMSPSPTTEAVPYRMMRWMAEGSSVGKACLFFSIGVFMFAQSALGDETHSSDSPPDHDSGNRRDCKHDKRDRRLTLNRIPCFGNTEPHIYGRYDQP